MNTNDRLPDFGPDEVIDRKVIEHNIATTDRSAARRVALQVLYELDTTTHGVGDVIAKHLEYHSFNSKIARYLHELVTGVQDNRDQLDVAIQKFAPEWPLSQVAAIDRNILRLAVFEFAIQRRAPVAVAISEAVELAKLFGADGAARFVNGVLGTLAGNQETMDAILRHQEDSNSDHVEQEEL